MSSFTKGFLIGGIFAVLAGMVGTALSETEKKKLEPCIQVDNPKPSKKV